MLKKYTSNTYRTKLGRCNFGADGVGHEGRKAFVQPQIIPPIHCHQVPKPLEAIPYDCVRNAKFAYSGIPLFTRKESHYCQTSTIGEQYYYCKTDKITLKRCHYSRTLL